MASFRSTPNNNKDLDPLKRLVQSRIDKKDKGLQEAIERIGKHYQQEYYADFAKMFYDGFDEGMHKGKPKSKQKAHPIIERLDPANDDIYGDFLASFDVINGIVKPRQSGKSSVFIQSTPKGGSAFGVGASIVQDYKDLIERNSKSGQ